MNVVTPAPMQHPLTRFRLPKMYCVPDFPPRSCLALGLCFLRARACCFLNSIIRVTSSTILPCRALTALSYGSMSLARSHGTRAHRSSGFMPQYDCVRLDGVGLPFPRESHLPGRLAVRIVQVIIDRYGEQVSGPLEFP